MKISKLLTTIGLIFAIATLPVLANGGGLLVNGSFENGEYGWHGNALNYFTPSCGDRMAKDGNCYALFNDASGTSLFEHNSAKRTGNYEASVAVRGSGQVRFGIWTFCPGQSPESHGFSGVQLNPQSWTTLKTKTSHSINNCEVKWEMYIDTDSAVKVDRARLYTTF